MPSTARTLSITWLGHSCFLVGLPGGPRVIFDPWLGNPRCPSAFAKPELLGVIDAIFVTHGHSDHLGDAASISRVTGAPIVCPHEVGKYLVDKGLKQVRGMGKGGTQEIAGVRVTMTDAVHSSSTVEDGRIVYLGTPAGFVIRAPDTPTLYFAGDTALFRDMKTIREVYQPAIAFLPIGDHFTMGPDTAAIAARWLGVRQVVPMHWGTFPVLTGTPEALERQLAGSGIEVLKIEPGETAE